MKNDIIKLISSMLINKYCVQADAIQPSSIYNDLALDSLTLLEITAILEKKFNIQIPLGVITSDMSIEESASNILRSIGSIAA